MRTRNRNPMPRALWLTIAFDGRGRPDPALGPARRLHTDHRHRARGAASVSGPPRVGRDPRLRDVAHLRARPPCPRRTRRARGRAHDGARRAAHRDPGGASVARPCSRDRPDVRRLPALRPDRARRRTGGGLGAPPAPRAHPPPPPPRASRLGGPGARGPWRRHRSPGAHARRRSARLRLRERLAPGRGPGARRRAAPRLGSARRQPGRQPDPLVVPARGDARPVPARLLRRHRGRCHVRRRRAFPRRHRHRAPPCAVARVGGGRLVLCRALQLAYFMAPAYVANMAPPFVRYWKGWNRPISRRWLGEHKTVLGFVVGVLAAMLVTFAQWRLAWSGSIVAYEEWPLLGLLFGVGAMAGDSAKSFFKRRLGVEPGRPWIPFDQLDFVLGALVLVAPRVAPAWADVVTILLLSFCGHILVNHLGYWLGVRDTRW